MRAAEDRVEVSRQPWMCQPLERAALVPEPEEAVWVLDEVRPWHLGDRTGMQAAGLDEERLVSAAASQTTDDPPSRGESVRRGERPGRHRAHLMLAGRLRVVVGRREYLCRTPPDVPLAGECKESPGG